MKKREKKLKKKYQIKLFIVNHGSTYYGEIFFLFGIFCILWAYTYDTYCMHSIQNDKENRKNVKMMEVVSYLFFITKQSRR